MKKRRAALLGGADALDVDDAISGMEALQAHAFFNMVYGNTMENEPPCPAFIASEQETATVPQKPAGLVNAGADGRIWFVRAQL